MKTFLKGLTTGLVLQLGIGPVFFFIINLALQKTIFDGFIKFPSKISDGKKRET